LDQYRAGISEREEKQLRALLRRKHREDTGRFLAEGVRVAEDLLASPLNVEWAMTSSSLGDNPRGAALVGLLQSRGIARREVPPEHFARLAATEHPQGILLVAEIPVMTLDALASPAPTPAVLLLDGIQDPGNFGTLVRTAEALGAAGIVALPGTVDPWNAKAVRAAAGSSFRVPLVQAEWSNAASWLRDRGYRLLAAEVGGEAARGGTGRLAIVMGNEGAGVSPQIRAEADGTIGIALRGRAESLNVAAAGAILLYELTR